MFNASLPIFARIATIIAVSAGIAAADSVLLRDHVRVTGEGAAGVQLRQVADLEGPLAEALGDLEVATLRGGQDQADVTLKAVREAIDGAGVNWGKLTLGGYARCKVQRPVALAAPASAVESAPSSPVVPVTVAPERGTLEAHLRDLLVKLNGAPADELRITFAAGDGQRLNASLSKGRFEVQPQSATGMGRVPLLVRRWEGERLAETSRISAHVARRYQAVVTRRTIGRGQTLAAEDLEVAGVWLDDSPAEVVTQVEQAVGRDTSAVLRKGAVVFARNLRSPMLVERGEPITVRCLSGSVVLTMTLRAGSDGGHDEVIEARNDQTRDTLRVRVMGPGQGVLVDAKSLLAVMEAHGNLRGDAR